MYVLLPLYHLLPVMHSPAVVWVVGSKACMFVVFLSQLVKTNHQLACMLCLVALQNTMML